MAQNILLVFGAFCFVQSQGNSGPEKRNNIIHYIWQMFSQISAFNLIYYQMIQNSILQHICILYDLLYPFLSPRGHEKCLFSKVKTIGLHSFMCMSNIPHQTDPWAECLFKDIKSFNFCASKICDLLKRVWSWKMKLLL